VECPLNQKTLTDKDNLCHGVEETCDFKDIPKSRYFIENHECKFCDFNFILVDGKCVECP
jgi:nitrite reductase/ring-hydroxylating ferredoxin subunit